MTNRAVSETFKQPPTDPLDDLRNYGVSEETQAVHPAGKPIIHSKIDGSGCPPVPTASWNRAYAGHFCIEGAQ